MGAEDETAWWFWLFQLVLSGWLDVSWSPDISLPLPETGVLELVFEL